MAPKNVEAPTTLYAENSQEDINHNSISKPTALQPIVWRNVIAFIYLHAAALYGLYLIPAQAKLLTFLWNYLVAAAGGMGVTAGAHRLWTHRSYKAKWPLRLVLMICQTIAFENDIYEWSRDHRVHHKYTDTDADPHNSKRGFFFSHMGWLLVRKHPDVIKKGANIDLSDLTQDPIVVFQRRFYVTLMVLCTFVIPVWVPCYFWNEDPYIAYHVTVFRFVALLHSTWLVNSAAHLWGMKPYDKDVSPTDNLITSIIAGGEGWHNYHHTFPWDYRTGEMNNLIGNFTTRLVDFFAWLGLAYDLKIASPEAIRKRAIKTGDGSKYHDE